MADIYSKRLKSIRKNCIKYHIAQGMSKEKALKKCSLDKLFVMEKNKQLTKQNILNHVQMLRKTCHDFHKAQGLTNKKAKKECQKNIFVTEKGQYVHEVTNRMINNAKKFVVPPTYDEKLKAVADKHYENKGYSKKERKSMCTKRKLQNVMELGKKLRAV
tara:strand:- start:434 stop:913 length:480 start_codon:yes stop_codon:yes gene_type:complete